MLLILKFGNVLSCCVGIHHFIRMININIDEMNTRVKLSKIETQTEKKKNNQLKKQIERMNYRINHLVKELEKEEEKHI